MSLALREALFVNHLAIVERDLFQVGEERLGTQGSGVSAWSAAAEDVHRCLLVLHSTPATGDACTAPKSAAAS